MPWKSVHAELTNKIRWSISTTAATVPCNVSFPDSQWVASMLANDVLDALKMLSANPSLSLRAAFRQKSVKHVEKMVDMDGNPTL